MSVYKNLGSSHLAPQQIWDGLAMQSQLGALVTCAAILVYAFLRRCRRLSAIRDVPGPVNPSWIFGTSPDDQPGPFRLLV